MAQKLSNPAVVVPLVEMTSEMQPPKPRDFRAEIDALVAELNQKYTLVLEEGKAVVFKSGFDQVLKRRKIDRISTRDFRTIYMNDRRQVGETEKCEAIYRTVAEIWLHDTGRRQFIEGVTFDPTTTKSEGGKLNLWGGFAIAPAKGDWSLMYDHIRSTICCGDETRFNYLMGWMARLVQRPAEQGEVAVVMKGGEGTGKGTLAKALMKIIGQHGLAISNAKHLTSNFNGHLRDAVFLFADEAFFAGDRAHVGVLKSLITEPYLTVEAKFQNAAQMPNFLHIMMASNEEWVVPASLDARRFLVLEVDENNKGNHDYFAQIWAEMDAGGYAAMLHDLLAYDISKFNVRDVPHTDGLQRQRKLSLPVAEVWWKDCLERGYIFRSKLGLEAKFAKWYETVSIELLFSSYKEFFLERRDRHPLDRERLGQFIGRMGGVKTRPGKGLTGEHLTDVKNPFGGTSRAAAPITSERPSSYKLGTLEEARVRFEGTTGLQVDWADEKTFPNSPES